MLYRTTGSNTILKQCISRISHSSYYNPNLIKIPFKQLQMKLVFGLAQEKIMMDNFIDNKLSKQIADTQSPRAVYLKCCSYKDISHVFHSIGQP